MKKFIGLTIAAVCALTACAFGLTGCNKVSDVVTEEEWVSAMSVKNALNVTMTMTGTSTSTETYGGVTETETASGTLEVKSALSFREDYSNIDYDSIDDFLDFGEENGVTYFLGVAYYNQNTDMIDAETNETITQTQTSYENYGSETYSYVSKETNSGEEDTWSGEYLQLDEARYMSPTTLNYYSLGLYGNIAGYMSMYQYNYEDFEYSEAGGAYVTDENGMSVYIKINDGYLTSMIVKGTSSYYYDEEYNYEVTVDYNFKFSNYGKTTVEIPEEYTYENYMANHSN